MSDAQPKIVPLGESAVVVEFGNTISVDLNNRSIALAKRLSEDPFPGFIEAVPAYTSTTVFYDLITIVKGNDERGSAFARVRKHVAAALDNAVNDLDTPREIIEIPTNFNAGAGLDLEYIADHCRLSVSDVIDIFTAGIYRVYMIGFLPGFAYMGEVDERIRMPRRDQPRLVVPKGSVGIAGSQTGVYPLESPGGWQVVGRTEIEFFLPDVDPPSFLIAGDRVRFVAV